MGMPLCDARAPHRLSLDRRVRTPSIAANEAPVAAVPRSGTVSIVVYVDYLAPFAAQFISAQQAQLLAWVKGGAAELELHPISILDRQSLGTRYSSRAANAAACVADASPDVFLAVNSALFTQQPAEGTKGLSDSQLGPLVAAAGAGDGSIASCITSEHFAFWVSAATNRALGGPLPGTSQQKVEGVPLVLVNGRAYTGILTDAAMFAQFVT